MVGPTSRKKEISSTIDHFSHTVTHVILLPHAYIILSKILLGPKLTTVPTYPRYRYLTFKILIFVFGVITK